MKRLAHFIFGSLKPHPGMFRLRLIVLRVRFWHWAMRYSARSHYLATRQAADANLAYINAHKRDVTP